MGDMLPSHADTVLNGMLTPTDIGINVLSLVPAPSYLSDTAMTTTPTEMDLDAQEALFFGHLGPLRKTPPSTSGALGDPASHNGGAKRQRTETDAKGQGKSHKGKGRGKGKGKGGPQLGPKMERGMYPAAAMWAYSSGSRSGLDTPWGREDALSEYKDSEAPQDWLEGKVYKLTQLVLRQEQTLASLRQDMVMHLFMKNGESGMIPILCETEEAPSKLSYSLKIALFKQLLITMHERLEAASQKEEALTHAKSLGWVDSEGHWLTLRWNPGQQALEVDSTVRGVPTKDLLTQLVQMRRGSTEETILRFQSRPNGYSFNWWFPFDRTQRRCGRHCRAGSGAQRGMCWGVVFDAEIWSYQCTDHSPCYIHPGSISRDSKVLGRPDAELTTLFMSPTEAPPLPRFIWEEGVMRRDHRSLLGYQCLVHMPIFDSPHEHTAHLAPYQVVAMQLHYGARPTSGHYRTAMLGQPKFGTEKVWLSDDESVPQPILREHDSAIYLIWLMQAPANGANVTSEE
ncbi:unnamed protein product [Symbiodinium necroappetens]|uniref:Uncharacterized protein n=1 Tax=Symbiodinium necroappetens TaxID=1628268 RepID=A0A813C6U5_9DINO|nr:unnamed protein product [Symbiodinium necroappetens]